MADRYFTFGQSHMCNHPDLKGRLADHWVRVTAEEGKHRNVFVQQFTSKYCPRPEQFAFEYGEFEFRPEYFPAGELTHIGG